MKVVLPSFNQLVDLSGEVDRQLMFENLGESVFQDFISRHYSRFLAGGGSITTLRSVSRKQLFNHQEKFISTDALAAKLSANIHKYNKAKVQLAREGYSLRTMMKVHKRIFRGRAAGKIRTRPCFIDRRQVQFVEHHEIAKKMSIWESLIRCREISGLSKVILGHAFFIGIHPFSDGNGRMSRLFVDSYLACEKNLVINPLLFNLFDQKSFKIAMVEFYQAKPSGQFFDFWKRAITRSISIQNVCHKELSYLNSALMDIGLPSAAIEWVFNRPFAREKEVMEQLGEECYQIFVQHKLLTYIDQSNGIVQINPIAMIISKMDELLFS